MTLKAVPIIDLAPYLEGTAKGKAKVAAEVGRACTDIGFLSIVGHGVPNELVEKCYTVSKEFFDLPSAVVPYPEETSRRLWQDEVPPSPLPLAGVR